MLTVRHYFAMTCGMGLRVGVLVCKGLSNMGQHFEGYSKWLCMYKNIEGVQSTKIRDELAKTRKYGVFSKRSSKGIGGEKRPPPPPTHTHACLTQSYSLYFLLSTFFSSSLKMKTEKKGGKKRGAGGGKK